MPTARTWKHLARERLEDVKPTIPRGERFWPITEHARQMDASTRREFAASFRQLENAQLSAPSWLWSSVVELASAHEAAYLEHCRRYALASSAK